MRQGAVRGPSSPTRPYSSVTYYSYSYYSYYSYCYVTILSTLSNPETLYSVMSDDSDAHHRFRGEPQRSPWDTTLSTGT